MDLDTKIVKSFAKELKSLSNTCLKKDDSALPGDEGEELSLVFKGISGFYLPAITFLFI